MAARLDAQFMRAPLSQSGRQAASQRPDSYVNLAPFPSYRRRRQQHVLRPGGQHLVGRARAPESTAIRANEPPPGRSDRTVLNRLRAECRYPNASAEKASTPSHWLASYLGYCWPPAKRRRRRCITLKIKQRARRVANCSAASLATHDNKARERESLLSLEISLSPGR